MSEENVNQESKKVNLAELSTVIEEQKAEERKPVIDSLGRSYATGKRKESIARVWLKPGSGKITVNKKTMEQYFTRPALQALIKQPFATVARESHYDIFCTISGGGLSGQAGALRHGISKALNLYDPTLRQSLKSNGLLTRDSRRVERKKYGLRKARRSFQFSKR